VLVGIMLVGIVPVGIAPVGIGTASPVSLPLALKITLAVENIGRRTPPIATIYKFLRGRYCVTPILDRHYT